MAEFLLLFGIIFFPLIFIIGMIKPSLFKKPDKTPATRKGIAIFSIIGALLSIGVGGALLPKAEDKTTAKVNTTDPSKNKKLVESTTPPADNNTAIKDIKSDEKTLKTTPSEFVERYNQVALQIDKNWVINHITNKKTGSVDFLPMPNNIGMSANLGKNGDLKQITIAFNGSEKSRDLVQTLSVVLGASSSVNPTAEKEEVSKKVMDMMQKSFDNKNKTQEVIIGDVKYSAMFMESLGAEMIIIEPK